MSTWTDDQSSDEFEPEGAFALIGDLIFVDDDAPPFKGGPGSGYHDPHYGRPGEQGGSAPRDGGGSTGQEGDDDYNLSPSGYSQMGSGVSELQRLGPSEERNSSASLGLSMVRRDEISPQRMFAGAEAAPTPSFDFTTEDQIRQTFLQDTPDRFALAAEEMGKIDVQLSKMQAWFTQASAGQTATASEHRQMVTERDALVARGEELRGQMDMAADMALGALADKLEPGVSMNRSVAWKGKNRQNMTLTHVRTIDALYRLASPEWREFLDTKLRIRYVDRNSYSVDSETVNVMENSEREAVVHEIGHAMQEQRVGWGLRKSPTSRAVRQFYAERTAYEAQPMLMSSFFRGNSGLENEYTKPDHWISQYTGYVNKADPESGVEVLSTGLEHLFSSPIEFARRDPSHFNFVIQVLRGR